jgi:hypothetical protein
VGSYIVLADGQWFRSAHIEMLRLCALGGTVRDELGEPVPGAYVRVLSRVPVGGQWQTVAGPVGTTDDRGEYRIANLWPGTYFVTVPNVQQSVPSYVAESEIGGLTPSVVARSAAADMGRQDALYRGLLVRGSTALVAGGYAAGPPTVGDQDRVYPMTYYPGTVSLSDAIALELQSGEERSGIDIPLRPVPAVRVSGRLEGCMAPCTGYVLRLVQEDLEAPGTGSEAATALVRSDGSFTFLNVPAGQYRLVAPGPTAEFALRPAVSVREVGLPSTPGIGRNTWGGSGRLVPGAPDLVWNAVVSSAIADPHAGYARIPLVIADRDATDLVVQLQPTAVLHARVVFEDLTGAPPSGTCEVIPASGSTELAFRTAQFSSSTPAFTIPYLVPGAYGLRFSSALGATVKSITLDGEDFSRTPVVLTAGQEASVLVTLTGKLIRLSGTVRDEHGVPVPCASVLAFPTDRQLWQGRGVSAMWIQVSAGSSDGSYQMSNLRAGEYYVVGIDSQNTSDWNDIGVLESASRYATRIRLNWGDLATADPRYMVTR